jgi:drug/metabolite transporter (DMT)-like permease
MTRVRDGRVLAAAGVTVVMWASAFVAIRSAGHHFGPAALALGRLLTGSVVLGVICLIRRVGWPPRAAWPGIAATGVLWFGLYMVALNWGEQKVDAGTAAMVVNVGPILVALLSGWLLGEGFPGRLFTGMAVSFVGAVVVGISLSHGGRAPILGVLLCLLSTASYAVAAVCQKLALRHASALQVTSFGCMIGTAATLPFTGQLVSQLRTAPLPMTLNVVYLGLFPTALAFTTWAYALSRTTAGRMGVSLYTVPVLVVVMSWLFLGEIPALLTFAGGLLCLAGVIVARQQPAQRERAATPAASGDDTAGSPAAVSVPAAEDS